MKTRFYRGYGLQIESDIPCPELADGSPCQSRDVVIRLGPVPERLTQPVSVGGYYDLEPDRVLLRIRSVGRYLVNAGIEIVVDRRWDAEEANLRMFLLGSGIGALLQQRGFLVLHGSSVKTEDGAVSFLGASGRGKSTLAWALNRRGWPLISDDIAAVRFSAGGLPCLLPGPPTFRLCLAAMETFGAASEWRADSDQKRVLPAFDRYCEQPTPLCRVYVLAEPDSSACVIRQLYGIDAASAILSHLYRPQFIVLAEDRTALFHGCVEIARHSMVYRVTWPRDSTRLMAFVDQLEHHLIEDHGPLASRSSTCVGITSRCSE